MGAGGARHAESAALLNDEVVRYLSTHSDGVVATGLPVSDPELPGAHLPRATKTGINVLVSIRALTTLPTNTGPLGACGRVHPTSRICVQSRMRVRVLFDVLGLGLAEIPIYTVVINAHEYDSTVPNSSPVEAVPKEKKTGETDIEAGLDAPQEVFLQEEGRQGSGSSTVPEEVETGCCG